MVHKVPAGEPVAGRTVVVTGAAGGFGRLLCEQLTALGARVCAGDVNEAALSELSQQMIEADLPFCSQVCDVTRADSLRELVATAVKHLGSVDVLINNAGTMPLAFYADHEAALPAWQRCIDINLKGVLHGIAAVYDHMIQQGRGHVVNISSIYSHFPVVGAGVYGATKAAVNFLSESLRVEAQGKIKVTTVKPTGVPATGLAAGVVNPEAVVGILGQNAPAYLQQMSGLATGELPASLTDAQDIAYAVLDPAHLVEQIVYAVNQPWGVSISEVTVRASGDAYIL